CAVEEDAFDRGVCVEEGFEVVGHHAVRLDRRIQAAVPPAQPQHIPHRDAGCQQRGDAVVVGGRRVESEDLTGDAPERVAGIAVVLARRQRHDAGHVAEDKDARAVADYGWQTLQQRSCHANRYTLTPWPRTSISRLRGCSTASTERCVPNGPSWSNGCST